MEELEGRMRWVAVSGAAVGWAMGLAYNLPVAAGSLG